MTGPTHLIIVCCHAIYLGPDCSDESNWLIEPFQSGETGTFTAHIEAGVRELARDNDALLVFSGGATKREKTDITEGESYLNVALERNLFGLETSPPTLRPRMFVDGFATDSYQNILFSIVQFPLFAQGIQNVTAPLSDAAPFTPSSSIQSPHTTFPTKLTIISHEFKRARFLDLHLPAIHWTRETQYIGINPPFDEAKLAQITSGERLRGYGAWEKDLYGVGELLTGKRKTRGWSEDAFRKEVLRRLTAEVRLQVERMVVWKGYGDLAGLRAGSVLWE